MRAAAWHLRKKVQPSLGDPAAISSAASRASQAQKTLRKAKVSELSLWLRSSGAILRERSALIARAINHDQQLLSAFESSLIANGEAENAVLSVANRLEGFADAVNELPYVTEEEKERRVDSVELESSVGDESSLGRRTMYASRSVRWLPVGPVATFSPRTSPLGVLNIDSLSALAARCCVVAMANQAFGTSAGECAAALAAARVGAGVQDAIPEEAFSVVHGGPFLAEALVQHEEIRGCGFVGSLQAGRLLHDLASQRPRPIAFHSSMGSGHAYFILESETTSYAKGNSTVALQLGRALVAHCGQSRARPSIVVLVGSTDHERKLFSADIARAASAAVNDLDSASVATHGGGAGGSGGDRVAAVPAAGPATPGLPCTKFNNVSTTLSRDLFVAACARVGMIDGITLTYSGGMDSSCEFQIFEAQPSNFACEPAAHEEMFGPALIVVHCNTNAEALMVARSLSRTLMATVRSSTLADEATLCDSLVSELETRVSQIRFSAPAPIGYDESLDDIYGTSYPSGIGSGHANASYAAAIRRWQLPVQMLAWN